MKEREGAARSDLHFHFSQPQIPAKQPFSHTQWQTHSAECVHLANSTMCFFIMHM